MESDQVKNNLKKRSFGVIALGLSIIIISFIRLLGTGSISVGFNFLSKSVITYIVIYSLVNNIASIIAAVGVLRIREWARKILIALSALQIVYMFTVSIPLSNKSIELMKTDPDAQAMILSGYTSVPETAKTGTDMTEEGYTKLVVNVIYVIANIIRLISIGFLLFIIFFFTRRNVKEQFIRISDIS